MFPVFQLFNSEGTRLTEVETMDIHQPKEEEVMRLKETLIFITPRQPMAVEISKQGWELRLFLKRKSDQLMSHKKFKFHFVPHEHHLITCNNCGEGPDKLSPHKTCARPGLKRRILDREDEAVTTFLNKRTVEDYPPTSSIENIARAQCVRNLAKHVVMTTLFPE